MREAGSTKSSDKTEYHPARHRLASWRKPWGPRLASLGLALATVSAWAGPVLVYREGAFCPRDRAPNAPHLTSEQAIDRAKTLIPKDFCGPNWYVDGCEYDPEHAFDTWRVFAQQYKLIDGHKEIRGRDHTYVVLDAVGNCLANIPGT